MSRSSSRWRRSPSTPERPSWGVLGRQPPPRCHAFAPPWHHPITIKLIIVIIVARVRDVAVVLRIRIHVCVGHLNIWRDLRSGVATVGQMVNRDIGTVEAPERPPRSQNTAFDGPVEVEGGDGRHRVFDPAVVPHVDGIMGLTTVLSKHPSTVGVPIPGILSRVMIY